MFHQHLNIKMVKTAAKRVLHTIVGVVLLSACGNDSQINFNKPNKALSGVDALQADSTGGFARAHRSRTFEFPEDHLAHAEYKHEWWYFTGNLTDIGGRQFGYQLTIFRIGLSPGEKLIKTGDPTSSSAGEKSQDSSEWRTNHIYMGHLALTDVNQNQFYHYEKFARAALGLAGSELVKSSVKEKSGEKASSIKIWLEDWQIVSNGSETFPVQLKAQKGDIAIDLNLTPAKPIVYHGYEGLSQKGSKQGNASYYYSITRLQTNGKLSIKGQSYEVTGNSWFDREWSTSTLEKNQVGWDWFSLQLADGRDIMFYKIRLDDNSMDRYSSGTIVNKEGGVTALTVEDVSVQELEDWQSPHSYVTYPARWKIGIPKENLELTIEPLLADQENNLTVRYWEGAVRVSGIQHNDKNKQEVNGYGYVELAGYR